MLPEVFPRPVSLSALEISYSPSRLFMGFNRELNETMIDSAVRQDAPNITGDVFETGYKMHRNAHFFKGLSSNITATVLADMEDGRAHDSEIYLGSPVNIFQYNRRRGSRTGVLWGLRNYFEPTASMGHPGTRKAFDDPAFADKIPQVFWRGGLTGSRWVDPFNRVGIASVANELRFEASRYQYSRINAVLMSKQESFMDCKFVDSDVQGFAWIREQAISGPRATTGDILRYRYVLCPNGNDVSSNLYWLLSTNSVAFKEECAYEVLPDYFLKPWVHYVPIAAGLTDLREKFDYCERNPDIVSRLLYNANSAYEDMTNLAQWLEAEATVLERMSLI